MREDIERAVIDIALYIIETGATVRNTAAHFGISKSTVHKDIKTRLKYINNALYTQVDKILQKNKAERHIRGGISTKNKYSNIKKNTDKKRTKC